MKKLEQLFIRACKSDSPYRRLRSVYRRFYRAGNNPDPHLVRILAGICDKYGLMSTLDLLVEMSPEKDWLYSDGAVSFNIRAINVMGSKIRLTSVRKMPGLSKPLRMKKAA